jgi:hypothetical protein
MIDVLISRIKDAYYELEGDHARRARFFGMTQAFTPGAIQLSPSQLADLGQRLMGAPQPNPGTIMPQQGTPPGGPPQSLPGGQPPAPAPEPSFLDVVDARR